MPKDLLTITVSYSEPELAATSFNMEEVLRICWEYCDFIVGNIFRFR